jgi:agmatine deiminase
MPDSFFLPPEWAPHAATWLAWPHNTTNDWPARLRAVQCAFAEMTRRLTPTEPVRMIAQNAAHRDSAARTLAAAAVDPARVEWIDCPTNRCWQRDSGPIFLKAARGRKVIADFHYNGWGGRCVAHGLDAKLAGHMARRLGLPLHEATIGRGNGARPFILEGGAIDGNGEGTLLTTEECLLDPKVQTRNPGFDRAAVEEALRRNLGARHVIWLGNGIAGDDTHGHVDDCCRFVGPRTIVYAREQNPKDENFRALEENRERLQGAQLADGSRPECVALPMPEPLYFHRRRLPASYANFYIANGVVLVPTFNDPADRVALGILAECFPDRTVVGIHAVDLLPGGGSLHCLTQQEPA